MPNTNWISMEVRPDYEGEYDVETDAGIIRDQFQNGAWQRENIVRRQWRGRVTKLAERERLALATSLEKRCESAAFRQAAAQAAVELGRAEQEKCARTGSKAALKKAVRLFHIAVGLGASLERRDEEIMAKWWPKLKAAPKKKVEDQVRRFIAGEVVKFD